MKAVIMAGGEGTRLRPLTTNAPKPMLPLANRPMMEHIIGLLKKHGFDEIVVTVAFMANAIQTYFGDGKDLGVTMFYAEEQTPLGTAGSVRNAMEFLDERFLVISGDVLTDIDLGKLVEYHDARKATATLGLVAVENPLEFGIVITNEDGTIERFLEKPTWGQVFSDTINTGIYVLDPEIFEYIPAGRPVDFSSEVFPALLAAGKPMYGDVVTGYWEDVGTLDAYLKAHQDVLDGRVAVDIPGFEIQPGVWIGPEAEISPDATITGPAIVGAGTRIEAGTRLGEYCVLGSNVRIRGDVNMERSVLHEGVYVASGARIRGALVGRSCDIRANASMDEGVVLGDSCFIGENAVIQGGVKVFPLKTVEAGAIVSSSIVWESKGSRSLFGRHGLGGLANVDITPELAAKVAMAYGASFPRGSWVITSRDSSRSARMLKRAMMAGLNASGINVLDLEIGSIPLTRFLARSARARAGLTVRLDPADAAAVVVRFFDGDGGDISEDAQRKIERLFQREDYRRVLPHEIGDISFPPRALEDYTAALSATVEMKTIYERHYKLVVDYGYGSVSFSMPSVLGKLGADVLAVNPYASTGGVIAFDRADHAERVAALVRASGAHLGAVFDPSGEQLHLIDDEGHVLSHDETLLAFVELVSPYLLGDTIALPVKVTQRAGEIAARSGRNVRWTKTSTAALMDASNDPGVGFAADGAGHFILPGFLPAYDGAAAFLKVLDLLARSGRKLSEVVTGLPRVHMAHEQIVTPWEQKGAVMRSLMEHAKDREVLLVDGVKVVHGPSTWALALPDPEEQLTHVYAEAPSDGEARRLAQEYGRRIRQMMPR